MLWNTKIASLPDYLRCWCGQLRKFVSERSVGASSRVPFEEQALENRHFIEIWTGVVVCRRPASCVSVWSGVEKYYEINREITKPHVMYVWMLCIHKYITCIYANKRRHGMPNAVRCEVNEARKWVGELVGATNTGMTKRHLLSKLQNFRFSSSRYADRLA